MKVERQHLLFYGTEALHDSSIKEFVSYIFVE
jgi:hypothetical protein